MFLTVSHQQEEPMSVLTSSTKNFQAFLLIPLLVLYLGLSVSTQAIASPLQYAIQIGAFQHSENASKLTADLNTKGYPAFYRAENEPSGKTWHKVYMGAYASHDEARQAAQAFRRQNAISKTFFIATLPGPVLKAAPPKPEEPTTRNVNGVAALSGSEKQVPAAEAEATPTPETTGRVSPEPLAVSAGPSGPDHPPRELSPHATAPASAIISPAPGSRMQEEQKSAPVFTERIAPRTAPLKLYSRREEVKNWRVSAGYRLWYVDMSSRYTLSSLAVRGYLHGPIFRVSFNKLTVQASALLTINDLDGNAVGEYTTGQGYTKHERLRRNDYDAVVKYRIDGPGRWFSVSPLLGFTYTRLSAMEATFTNTINQRYTLTGHMDIWGPTLGLEVHIPLGNPETTPLSIGLSGSGMYLRATGRHPGHWPAQGGAFETTFQGAEFASWGWGGVADAHLRWAIFDAMELLAGGRFQSADISDNSPAATTMRISNGFIGAYANLNLVW
jgi:hypothetical protein